MFPNHKDLLSQLQTTRTHAPIMRSEETSVTMIYNKDSLERFQSKALSPTLQRAARCKQLPTVSLATNQIASNHSSSVPRYGLQFSRPAQIQANGGCIQKGYEEEGAEIGHLWAAIDSLKSSLQKLQTEHQISLFQLEEQKRYNLKLETQFRDAREQLRLTHSSAFDSNVRKSKSNYSRSTMGRSSGRSNPGSRKNSLSSDIDSSWNEDDRKRFWQEEGIYISPATTRNVNTSQNNSHFSSHSKSLSRHHESAENIRVSLGEKGSEETASIGSASSSNSWNDPALRYHGLSLTKSVSQPDLRNHAPSLPINITVISNQFTLNTVVFPFWSISETKKKIAKKYNGPCAQFDLYVRRGSNWNLKRLKNDKTIQHYIQYFQDMKYTILFQGEKKWFEFGKEKEGLDSTNCLSSLTLGEILCDAILADDIRQIEICLESVTKEIMEENIYNVGIPLHVAVQSTEEIFNIIIHRYSTNPDWDLNIVDKSNGWTALHYVAAGGQDDHLSCLLSLDAVDVTIVDNEGNTAFHIWAQHSSPIDMLTIGKLWLSRDVKLVETKNNAGEIALHRAMSNRGVRMQMVNFLLSVGSDVNSLTQNGETPIMLAVHMGVRDIIKILVMAGADLSKRDAKEKKTALEWASYTNQHDLTKSLRRIQDLQTWLTENNMNQYILPFVRDEEWLDKLASYSEDQWIAFCSKMKIDSHTMTKFKSAWISLKERHSRQQFLDGMLRASRNNNHSVEGKNSANREVENIARLQESMNEIAKTTSRRNNRENYDWKVEHCDVEFLREIGSGTSGMVFEGRFRGKQAAIKVIRDQHKDRVTDLFLKEFEVMSTIRSSHVVQFYGAILEPRICIVMEYCIEGSLHDVLRTEGEMPWSTALCYMKQMLQGVHTLHSAEPPIFHRDLKSPNILVDSKHHLKICDFGLARAFTPENKNTMAKLCGTYNYTAPELYSGGSYTAKCDIYSLGMIFWEVLWRKMTGSYKQPYADHPKLKQSYQIFFHVAKKGLRPTMPVGCHQSLSVFIASILDANPTKRPDTSQLLRCMDQLEAVLID
ncbi:hypothetical protein PROFUN_03678 [Planoprotostelium fungivorum]|uniref:Protein kinase domain-containing protein n=1 Tax=Planoprotostelium fungivorum TaxID=1890364 RepID=A0A2P6NSM6_9EUKA|nr:hypothetical protein PROFUN_03678 [Planoprotostelium fungivorum]